MQIIIIFHMKQQQIRNAEVAVMQFTPSRRPKAKITEPKLAFKFDYVLDTLSFISGILFSLLTTSLMSVLWYDGV